MKAPERYLDFVSQVIDDLRLAVVVVTGTGMLLLVPLYQEVNTWYKSIYATAGVAAVGFASAGIESRRQYYVKALRAYIDVSDQIEVQKHWDSRTTEKQLPPTTSSSGFVTENPCPEDLKEIIWKDFVINYIEQPISKPHFNIIGSTGDGKSITAEVIGDLRAAHYASKDLTPRQVYLSPTVDDNEFRGWELVGNGFKKQEIKEFADYLANVLIHRYVDSGADKTPVIVVNDESRWSNKNTELPETINNILAMGRKQHLNIINTNVTNLVESQGMRGEGDLRKNYTTILKGEQALDFVRVEENEGRMPEGSVAYCTELYENHRYRFSILSNTSSVLMLPDFSLYRPTKVNREVGYKPVEEFVLPPAEEPKKTSTRKRS